MGNSHFVVFIILGVSPPYQENVDIIFTKANKSLFALLLQLSSHQIQGGLAIFYEVFFWMPVGHKYGAQLDSGQYAKLTNGAKSASRWSTVACQVGFWNLATSHSHLGPLGLDK